MEDLGKKIRKARKASGMTMGEVAEESGLTIASVFNAETGKGTPKPSTVKSIAKAIGVDESTWMEWVRMI